MPKYATIYEETHKRIVQSLRNERRPFGYREAYERFAVLDHTSPLGPKTDPVEKLRQYYAEHERPDVLFVGNGRGYFALKHWFPFRAQSSLFPPDEKVMIQGDVLVGHDAGYEHAKREPYMMNHYGRNHGALFDRRKSAYLVEQHVKSYFQTKYPRFYIPPDNEGLHDKPCGHDFKLRLRNRLISVDVKSWSYRSEETGLETAAIPNPKDVILYLFADLCAKENHVLMHGVATGQMVRLLGLESDGISRTMFHVAENHIWSIDVLLVLLNMEDRNLSWHEFEKDLLRW